jgi:thioredoxin-like negative regulator of GroEL
MPAFLRRALIAAVAVMALASPGAAAGAIPWETKLERATAAARETNQPILIEFWAVGCEPCQAMDRDVYSDERVAVAMGRVRPVRIDIDRDARTARTYKIDATPTLVLTDSFGRELFRYAGSLPLDRMLQLLEALPRDVRRINELSAAVAAQKDDFDALTALARELRGAAFYLASSEYYARALKTRTGRQPGPGRTGILIDMARNALDLRLYADAERLCTQALAAAAGTPDEAAVRADLARARRGRSGG